MFYYYLLQLVATCLVTYLSGTKRHGLFDIKEYARIAYSRPPPPPPPQLCFRTSADFADEYHLLSLANLTVTMPSRLSNDNPDSFQIPDDTETPFQVSSLPPLLHGVLYSVVKMGLWIVSAVAEVLIASLHLLGTMVSPVATVAYALRQQRKQDWSNFRMRSLLPSWGLARTVDKQRRFIDLLITQFERSEKKRAGLKTKFPPLGRELKALRKELGTRGDVILAQQQLVETLTGRVEQKTQEGEVLRGVRDRLLEAVEKLRTGLQDNGDIIRHLEATVQRQDGRIQQREDDLDQQQQDSSAKFTSYELEIAATNDNLQAITAEAAERQAQADKRICELEEQQKSGRESAEKAEADLKAARENIERLQSTIRSNANELQMYRDRASRQRAQHLSTPPFRPAPMPFQPAQMPFPPGQAPFAPRPTQIPGFPPNRTSGFMGSAPPQG